MESFFDDFWEPELTLIKMPRIEFPRLDIKEEETEYLITAEVPGFTKEEINIEVKDDMLTISSEHKEEKEEEKEGYIYKERSHRTFHRSLRIPDYISYEEIDAKLENGLLKLHFPKREPESPKKVEIQGHEEPEKLEVKSVWKKLAEDTKPD
jgi:HSP20 family protein